MEISHTLHSHIIGRGGKNTQDVMKETNCHIHFPDSNKHNDVEKNNQVSIAGSITQVELARSKLRLISPITINVNIELTNLNVATINLQDIQRKISTSDVLSQLILNGTTLQLTIKSSLQYEELIINSIKKFFTILNNYGLSTDTSICLSNFDLRPTLLHSNYGLFDLNTIRWIAYNTKTQMQFSPQGSSILIMGSISSLFSARRYLTVSFLN